MRIAILMSTYNGELYLKEQLDSIFNQTNDEELEKSGTCLNGFAW